MEHFNNINPRLLSCCLHDVLKIMDNHWENDYSYNKIGELGEQIPRGLDKNPGTVKFGARGAKAGCTHLCCCIGNVDNMHDMLESAVDLT